MRRLFPIGVIIGLLVTMASICFAAANLNLSKSNVNRLVYDPAVVTPAQAAAFLKEVDKLGPGVNEATVRRVLQQQGANLAPIKKISVLPPDKTRKEPLILLLKNPADEAQARTAVGDPGPDDPPYRPPVKSTK